MSRRIPCLCGQRIEIAANESPTLVECATCGRKIDLSPPQFDAAPASPTPSETPSGPSATCPDCAGSGKCPHCNRPREFSWMRLWNWTENFVESVLATLLEGRLNSPTARFGSNRRIANRHIQSNRCVACDGRKTCYKCRGTGSYSAG